MPCPTRQINGDKLVVIDFCKLAGLSALLRPTLTSVSAQGEPDLASERASLGTDAAACT